MTDEDFVLMTLPEKIVWLHGPEGPRGKLSHDVFAGILKTSRQVVIGWEKPGGPDPSPRLRKALATFSGRPESLFSRRGAEAVVVETTGARLRSLAADLGKSARKQTTMARELRQLRAHVQQLEARPWPDEAPTTDQAAR